MWIPAECQPTSLELVSRLREEGFIFEEKHDGIRAVVQVGTDGNIVTGRRWNDDGTLAEITKTHAAYLRAVRFSPWLFGCVFDGELMPDGSYWIFDCLQFQGADIRGLTLASRESVWAGCEDQFPEFVRRVEIHESFSDVGDFGEGVVVKDLQSKYGFGWWKAKRIETDDVFVLAVDHDAGTADVGSGKVSGVPDSVRVGDCIEVQFFKRFNSGKLRNGKFLRVRDDKGAACRLASPSTSPSFSAPQPS